MVGSEGFFIAAVRAVEEVNIGEEMRAGNACVTNAKMGDDKWTMTMG